MIETTREICKHCGKEYDDSHIVPRAEYAPYWCEECLAEINEACGSWMSVVFSASKNTNPYEEG